MLVVPEVGPGNKIFEVLPALETPVLGECDLPGLGELRGLGVGLGRNTLGYVPGDDALNEFKAESQVSNDIFGGAGLCAVVPADGADGFDAESPCTCSRPGVTGASSERPGEGLADWTCGEEELLLLTPLPRRTGSVLSARLSLLSSF